MTKGVINIHLVSGEEIMRNFNSTLNEKQIINKINLEMSGGGVGEIPVTIENSSKSNDKYQKKLIINWMLVDFYEIGFEK